MRIPSGLTAGDSADWVDYPFTDGLGRSVDAGSYTLTYSLRGPGATLDITGTPVGTSWQFNLAPSDTAAMNTGAARALWYWAAYATKSGARLTAGQGTLSVRANLAALTGSFDGRSEAERCLAAIDAEITARINGGATLEYTIGQRSLKKEPLAALQALRAEYLLRVSRERRSQQIANGLGNPQRLGVRFK